MVDFRSLFIETGFVDIAYLLAFWCISYIFLELLLRKKIKTDIKILSSFVFALIIWSSYTAMAFLKGFLQFIIVTLVVIFLFILLFGYLGIEEISKAIKAKGGYILGALLFVIIIAILALWFPIGTTLWVAPTNVSGGGENATSQVPPTTAAAQAVIFDPKVLFTILFLGSFVIIAYIIGKGK